MRCVSSSIPGSLDGRTALVTGSTSGIGFEIARELHLRGAFVILTGRSHARANAAVERIKRANATVDFRAGASSEGATGAAHEEVGDLLAVAADLSDLSQVRDLCTRVKDRVNVLDILVLNAGMTYMGYRGSLESVSTGKDMLYSANVLGNILVAMELKEAVKRSKLPGRVVTTGSVMQWFGYHGRDLSNPLKFDGSHLRAVEAYSCSKLAMHVFAAQFQDVLRSEGSQVLVRAVTPGMVATPLNVPEHERGDFGPAEQQLDSTQYSRRFNARQGAMFVLGAAFVDPAKGSENLHLHLLAPYWLPSFVTWARPLGLLSWFAENAQKMSAHEGQLFVWPSHRTVIDLALRQEIFNDWMCQVGLKSIE